MAAEDSNEELYSVMYRAVNDALWNVIGTVVATGVLLVVFYIGLSALLDAATLGPSTSVFGVLFGVVLVVFSLLSFASMFDLLPWS
jgi:hypothetical protein